ncbi:hypothetical protein LTR56_014445 [Elasticomyces elasticus]|nr:hypothetical protein LTR56_014445 [Elasticomyces elasticus]KAK3646503.1 hypothetical protein LTR22_014266 [Elasticomyces elasticus]
MLGQHFLAASTWLLTLPASHAAPANDPMGLDRRATVDPTNATDLCFASKNADLWTAYEIGDWFKSWSTSMQPFDTGVVNALVRQVPGLLENDWNCTIENCQPLNVEGDGCAGEAGTDARAYFVLYSVQNFMQFWRNFRDKINAVASQSPLGGDVAQMVEVFTYTKPGPSASEEKVIQGLDIALAVLGALFSVVGGKKGAEPLGVSSDAWKSGGDALKLGGALANTVAFSTDSSVDDDPDTIYWQNFVNTTSLITNQQTVLVKAIEDFTYMLAFDIPENGSTSYGAETQYQEDPNQLPGIFYDGGFAAPPPDIIDNDDLSNLILAGLSSIAINNLWAYDQVIVVKTSGVGVGANPCVNGDLFSEPYYYCDSDGNMFVLQRWPTADDIDAIYSSGMKDLTQFGVQGIDSLADYGLDIPSITQASWRNQQATGVYGDWQQQSDLLDYWSKLNPNTSTLADTISFNLPVCDLDLVAQTVNQDTSACTNLACVYTTMMICGCRNLPKFPYWTQPGDFSGDTTPGDAVDDPYCKVSYPPNSGNAIEAQACVGAGCMDPAWVTTEGSGDGTFGP